MSEIPPMLTLDPGLSDTKSIWRVTPFKPELQMTSPEVTEVSREAIDFYKSRRLVAAEPENEAWVEYDGNIYAVGFLAYKHFGARVDMEEPKYEWAIAKVLATVGIMIVKEGLPEEIPLALAIPLPFTEWEARHRFQRDVEKALANFLFCDKPLSVKLKLLICVPEGGGHVMARGEKIGSAFADRKNIAVMWGYRDISAVLFDRSVIDGNTEKLGFFKMIQLVQSRTFGQKGRNRERLLLETIHSVGKAIKSNNFKSLTVSKHQERKAEEAELLTEAVKLARTEYWGMVSRFLLSNIPADVDEIIVGGGSHDYFKTELRSFLAQNFANANISWSAELEEDVRSTFNLSTADKALCMRLTDAYGLSNFLRSQVCPNGALAMKQG